MKVAPVPMQEELNQLVSIKRSIPDCYEVRGSIVSQSSAWLVIALLNDAVFYDGYVAIRQRDIETITDISRTGFERKALTALGREPKPLQSVSSASASGLVKSMAQQYRLITIRREFRNPDTCVIGEIVSIGRSEIELRSITRSARFDRGTWTVSFSDITRIDWGGMYEQAIEAVLPKKRKTSI